MSQRPWLSMVVVLYNMPRVARRTLLSLSAEYQRGLDDDDYEVIVVDNGSNPPVLAEDVECFGPQFKLVTVAEPSVSPVSAVNEAVRNSSGELVGVMLDGARMLTPGALTALRLGAALRSRSFVSLLAWHLGPDHQSRSMLHGYDERAEDKLLRSIGWPSNGYNLFSIASLESSNPAGWFGPVAESTCFVTPRPAWDELGGFDGRFRSPGAGLANHELLHRVARLEDLDVVIALGEGTFHQLHGGVSTNSAVDRWTQFEEEYAALTGAPYSWPSLDPYWVGHVPESALQWIGASAEVDRLTRGNETLMAHARSLGEQVVLIQDALAAANVRADALMVAIATRPLPGVIGATAPAASAGIRDENMVEPTATIVCDLMRHADQLVLEGWAPERVAGERILEVEVSGAIRRYAITAGGFFVVRMPVETHGGETVTIHLRTAWSFDPAIVPAGVDGTICWKLIGVRFEDSTLGQSDELV